MQGSIAGSTGAAPSGSIAVPDVTRTRCKVERVAGSNIPKRICLTEAEWAEIREGSQQAYDEVRRGQQAPPESTQ